MVSSGASTAFGGTVCQVARKARSYRRWAAYVGARLRATGHIAV